MSLPSRARPGRRRVFPAAWYRRRLEAQDETAQSGNRSGRWAADMARRDGARCKSPVLGSRPQQSSSLEESVYPATMAATVPTQPAPLAFVTKGRVATNQPPSAKGSRRDDQATRSMCSTPAGYAVRRARGSTCHKGHGGRRDILGWVRRPRVRGSARWRIERHARCVERCVVWVCFASGGGRR